MASNDSMRHMLQVTFKVDTVNYDLKESILLFGSCRENRVPTEAMQVFVFVSQLACKSVSLEENHFYVTVWRCKSGVSTFVTISWSNPNAQPVADGLPEFYIHRGLDNEVSDWLDKLQKWQRRYACDWSFYGVVEKYDAHCRGLDSLEGEPVVELPTDDDYDEAPTHQFRNAFSWRNTARVLRRAGLTTSDADVYKYQFREPLKLLYLRALLSFPIPHISSTSFENPDFVKMLRDACVEAVQPPPLIPSSTGIRYDYHCSGNLMKPFYFWSRERDAQDEANVDDDDDDEYTPEGQRRRVDAALPEKKRRPLAERMMLTKFLHHRLRGPIRSDSHCQRYRNRFPGGNLIGDTPWEKLANELKYCKSAVVLLNHMMGRCDMEIAVKELQIRMLESTFFPRLKELRQKMLAARNKQQREIMKLNRRPLHDYAEELADEDDEEFWRGHDSLKRTGAVHGEYGVVLEEGIDEWAEFKKERERFEEALRHRGFLRDIVDLRRRKWDVFVSWTQSTTIRDSMCTSVRSTVTSWSPELFHREVMLIDTERFLREEVDVLGRLSARCDNIPAMIGRCAQKQHIVDLSLWHSLRFTYNTYMYMEAAQYSAMDLTQKCLNLCSDGPAAVGKSFTTDKVYETFLKDTVHRQEEFASSKFFTGGNNPVNMSLWIMGMLFPLFRLHLVPLRRR